MNKTSGSGNAAYWGICTITGARAMCNSDNPDYEEGVSKSYLGTSVEICAYCRTKFIPTSINDYRCPHCNAPSG